LLNDLTRRQRGLRAGQALIQVLLGGREMARQQRGLVARVELRLALNLWSKQYVCGT